MSRASPLLAQANRVTVWFDRSGKVGRWSTTIVHRDVLITTERHRSEQEARAHVGLEGGSPDPNVHPPAGSTGYITVELTPHTQQGASHGS